MGSKFGKLSTGGFRGRGLRERALFVAAASFTLVIVISFVILSNIKQQAPGTTTVESSLQPSAATAGNAIKLFGAERAIPKGTKLSEVNFKTLSWPRHSVPEDAIRTKEELATLYARVDLAPGMPVLKSQTTTQPVNENTASLRLTPGNRAVSIEVDETSGLEGHATPGTHVDVVLTHSRGGELESSIIVENARVLSYGGDTSIDKNPGRGALKINRTITLDVSTADALKISTARQMGRLSLFMRAVDDDKAANVTVLDANELDRKGAENSRTKPQACTKGKVRIGEKTFLMGCDGSMTPVEDK